jgi:hypothetical protein
MLLILTTANASHDQILQIIQIGFQIGLQIIQNCEYPQPKHLQLLPLQLFNQNLCCWGPTKLLVDPSFFYANKVANMFNGSIASAM